MNESQHVNVSSYEAGEVLEQWQFFAKAKGVPPEAIRLSPDEIDRILTLYALWKELFGYGSILPLAWADVDTILHIHHFDLLLELYFNYKARGIPFDPGSLD